MAAFGALIESSVNDHVSQRGGAGTAGGTLLGIFVVTFLVASLAQWYFFSRMASLARDSESDSERGSPLLNPAKDAEKGKGAAAAAASPADDIATAGLWVQLAGIPGSLLEALKIIISNRPILFRLCFLGLEIALEDAVVVVVGTQLGLSLPWMGDGGAVRGNIWTSVCVAVGKLGGLIASLVMMRFFKPPSQIRGFWFLFLLVFVSSCATLGFPATVVGVRTGVLTERAGQALVLLTFFVFFFFSTLPKIGLMTLLQNMVSQVENGPRIFGFIAIVATTFDALVIMGLSAIFDRFPLEESLWITAGIFCAHGLGELTLGPALVLMPLSHAAPPAPATDAGYSKLEATAVRDASPLVRMPPSQRPPAESPRMVPMGRSPLVSIGSPLRGGSFRGHGTPTLTPKFGTPVSRRRMRNERRATNASFNDD